MPGKLCRTGRALGQSSVGSGFTGNARSWWETLQAQVPGQQGSLPTEGSHCQRPAEHLNSCTSRSPGAGQTHGHSLIPRGKKYCIAEENLPARARLGVTMLPPRPDALKRNSPTPCRASLMITSHPPSQRTKLFLMGPGHRNSGSGRHPALWEQHSQAIRHPTEQEFPPPQDTSPVQRSCSCPERVQPKEFARTGTRREAKHRVLHKAHEQRCQGMATPWSCNHIYPIQSAGFAPHPSQTRMSNSFLMDALANSC